MNIELLVRYRGDINSVAKELGGYAEILSADIAILTINQSKTAELYSKKEIEYIEEPRNLSLLMSESRHFACIDEAVQKYNLNGEGVLVGLLDSGIDYTHKDFIKEDNTTRILYIWDMLAEGRPVYTENDINEALKAPNPLAIISQIDTIGHGTAVAAVACGNGRASDGVERGIATQSPIIAVKLGHNESINASRTTELMRGLKFLSDKAIELNMPMAINISFGTNDGPHDGSSLFEHYINEVALQFGISICVATGNEGASGHHVAGKIAPYSSESVELFVSGGNPSLYIILWHDFADVFNIELVDSANNSTGIVSINEGKKTIAIDSMNILINIEKPSHYNKDAEIFIEIMGKNGNILQGIWKIIIHSLEVVSGEYNIWLPTAEEIGKNTAFARPSPQYTITIPATAKNVISVGAYDGTRDAIASFSGRGGPAGKPDIVAPGVNVLSARAGGGYDAFSGTSIAAPFATGAAALLLQWGIVQKNDPTLYGEKIKAYLHLGATRTNSITYPNDIWGYGKLCLKNSLDYANNSQTHLPPHPPSEGTPPQEGNISEKTSFGQQFPSRGGVDLNLREEIQRRGGRGCTISLAATETDVSLAEYASMPGIVDILFRYHQNFVNYVKDKPYIKIAAVISNMAIVYLPASMLDSVLRDLNVNYAQIASKPMGLLGRGSLISSGILQVQQRPFMDLKGRGVLIGFIDTGIDYTQQAFRYDNGSTKITHIWDMTAPSSANSNVLFGAEYTRDDINLALLDDNPQSIVPHKDNEGHGTFLASVAAGKDEGEYIGAAPDAEIIMVKMRELRPYYMERYRIPEGEQNAFSSTEFILAMDYITKKASEMGRPVAICISLGTGYGLRSGLSLLEEYVSDVARRQGIAIAAAVGNEANKRRHAQGKISPDESQTALEVEVGEGVDSLTVHLAIKEQDNVYVSVVSPAGEIVSSAPTFTNESLTRRLVLEKSIVNINYFFSTEGLGSKLIEIIIDKPTAGIWSININAVLILDGNFQAWMPMDGFMDNRVEFMNPSPSYTILNPATAIGVISVGAYDERANSLYIDSSHGSTILGINKPTLAASGVDVSGIFPYGAGQMSGTSVACSITAGALAIMLQWGIIDKNDPLINTIRIRSFLIQGAAREPNTTYPNDQWGFGRLNLLETFNALKR